MKFIETLINWGKLTPLYDFLGKRSYAQSGEDVVVDALLSRQKKGFYIDIGAFHPKIFSNTYLFYKRGWQGICVEPNPEAKRLFEWARPRDKFLNHGVIPKTQELKNFPREYSGLTSFARTQDIGMEYFVFGEGATNTFDKKAAEENIKVGRKLLKTIKVPVMEINELLKKYVPKGKKIDLLSIDVEGMDEEILRSWNWKRYKPGIIVAEDMSCHSELDSESRKTWMPDSLGDTRDWQVRHDKGGSGLRGFLEGKGYKLVGMTGYSLVFRSSMVDGRTPQS